MFELVHRIDAVRLAPGLAPPGAANRRGQFLVGVGVFLHQVKLHLGRNDRLPALGLVQLQNLSQHVARGQRVQSPLAQVAVVDDQRGRLIGPRHHAHGVGVGLQDHVAVSGADQLGFLLGVVAGHCRDQDGLGQAAVFLDEFIGRDKLAAGIAGHVRNNAFHFRNTVFTQPLVDYGQRHGSPGNKSGVTSA